MRKNKLDNKELKALFFIRDNVLYKDRSPSQRSIAEELGYKSPRSASLILDSLEKKGYIRRTEEGRVMLVKDIDGKEQSNRIIELPLVGAVSCGLPFLAEENIEAMIPISQRIAKPGAKYFLLRAVGNSMNRAGIKDGDLMVVRQQPVADEGQRVVALIGDEATIKEFHRKGDKIVLMPRSSEKKHQPIILNGDFMIQGVVVDTIPDLF